MTDPLYASAMLVVWSSVPIVPTVPIVPVYTLYTVYTVYVVIYLVKVYLAMRMCTYK